MAFTVIAHFCRAPLTCCPVYAIYLFSGLRFFFSFIFFLSQSFSSKPHSNIVLCVHINVAWFWCGFFSPFGSRFSRTSKKKVEQTTLNSGIWIDLSQWNGNGGDGQRLLKTQRKFIRFRWNSQLRLVICRNCIVPRLLYIHTLLIWVFNSINEHCPSRGEREKRKSITAHSQDVWPKHTEQRHCTQIIAAS